jgi:hypothetical protein
MSCEAQRDLVFARARQALSQCQNQRNRLARPTEPEFYASDSGDVRERFA